MSQKSRKNTLDLSSNRVDHCFHHIHWLLSAFASTLVFIVFIMQVYRIPTGSMADTLKGAHFRLRCEQCGYGFDYGFSPEDYRKLGYKFTNTSIPSFKLPIMDSCRCPSCGYFYRIGERLNNGKLRVEQNGKLVPVQSRQLYKGDQIFVLKCIYQFLEPNRWDVVVFKNPLEPKIHYIKRLIAKPGEQVEIIDGDVYINGLIARKPPHVQEELWMPIYDNDYHPARPQEARFNGHVWKLPFKKLNDSGWDLTVKDGHVFALNSEDPSIHAIEYDTRLGNDFKSVYAYDTIRVIPNMPICSDLMMRFYAELDAESSIGIELSKYGRRYQGWIRKGQLTIEQISSDCKDMYVLAGPVAVDSPLQSTLIRFANVDHQLVLECGNQNLRFDLGRKSQDVGTKRSTAPSARILGRGRIQLSHIALFRDIFYLSHGQQIKRTQEGNPLSLNENEFFVCGDNSPFSLDSRMWKKPGLANNGQEYREGIVPRDYLVGKAFFVHWPGGYEAIPRFFRFILQADGIKLIYGGLYNWE